MGVHTQTRFQKGTVSVAPYKDGLRLRWRTRDKRPELYVPGSIPDYKKTALRIKTMIEQDLMTKDGYDASLQRYKELIKQAALNELLEEQLQLSPVLRSFPETRIENKKLNILEEFESYLTAKSMDIASENLSSYYTQTIAMLKKWGDFKVDDTPKLMGRETFGPKTFNDRRNCLIKFYGWMVKKKKIADNPLEEVATKKRLRNHEQRKPFTSDEANKILAALKFDEFRQKSSRYSHSQYYPIVAFMLQTGVRNGEAIGLKVKDLLWDSNEVRIARALARTSKGSHIKVRKEKGTKMNNVRFLPLNKKLTLLLKPLCFGKTGENYVFTNENGNPIDDRMFQRRVFKPVLKSLDIEKRDLYACRHTFATRAVQSGMKANEVAYLMGDDLETVLANYYHKEKRADALPTILNEQVA